MDNFSIDFKEIGKLERKLNRVKNTYPQKQKQVLQEVDKIVRGAYKRQFATEGVEFGKRWKPLARSTQKDRKRKGFKPAHPILVRTGKLRSKILNAKKTLSKKELKLTANIRPRKRKIIKREGYISSKSWVRIKSNFERMLRNIRREIER